MQRYIALDIYPYKQKYETFLDFSMSLPSNLRIFYIYIIKKIIYDFHSFNYVTSAVPRFTQCATLKFVFIGIDIIYK